MKSFSYIIFSITCFFSGKVFAMDLEDSIKNLLNSSDNKELSYSMAKYLERSVKEVVSNGIKQSLLKEILKNPNVNILEQNLKFDKVDFLAPSTIKGVTFSPNGNFLIINTDQGFDLYRFTDSFSNIQLLYQYRGDNQQIKSIDSVVFNSNSTSFLMILNKKNIVIFDSENQSISRKRLTYDNLIAANFSHDNNIIAVNSDDIFAIKLLEQERTAEIIHSIRAKVKISTASICSNKIFINDGRFQRFIEFQDDKLKESSLFFQLPSSSKDMSYINAFGPNAKYLVSMTFHYNYAIYDSIEIFDRENNFNRLGSKNINLRVGNTQFISINKYNDFISLSQANKISRGGKVLLIDITNPMNPVDFCALDAEIGVFSPDGKYFALAKENKVTIYNWFKFQLGQLSISNLMLIKYLLESDDINKALVNPLLQSDFERLLPSIQKIIRSYCIQKSINLTDQNLLKIIQDYI